MTVPVASPPEETNRPPAPLLLPLATNVVLEATPPDDTIS
jgi:hypothetical protein